MSTRPVWYRSLYWRIGLGLVLFLVLMLAAQGLLFIYLTERLAGSMPARSPRELAMLVAADVSSALENDPKVELTAYVRTRYGHVFQPIVVALRDGRVVSNREGAVSEELLALIRRQATMPPVRRRFGRNGGPGMPMPPPPGDDRAPSEGPIGPPGGGGGPRPFPFMAGIRRQADIAPVLVQGERLGVVAVPLGRPPFALLARELGPTMGAVGVAVLLLGGAGMAFLVFGPARRRLLQLEAATTDLGAGNLAVRAPEHGGDEVAALARAFNRMAEDLAARAAALEVSDAARRQLLADVSHELMTPLTAMRGYIETLSMPELTLDAATRARYLGIVDEETRRLEHIIGDLLDLARLEGNGQALRQDAVPIAALFGRVSARHERELVARHITLEHHIEAGAETVRGDGDRLEQALQNLAGNALRHVPDGGVITLRAATRGDRIVLTVRDTGPGIPPEHLPLIFDRFYKVDSARRAAGGSGLGLSIVRAIVTRHGGTVQARNDGGAVFELVLPGRG